MLNPATLLSANTGLSALLGGTVSAGNGTGTVAANGNQSVDFSTLLSGNTALAATKTPSATLSVAPLPNLSDKDDSAAAPVAVSGKGLPLAALTAAVLPVPITLAALVDKPTDTAPQDDGTQPATSPDSVSQSAALLAAAQATTLVQPLPMAPTVVVQVTRSLAQPGFSLIPATAATPATATPGDTAQPTLTLSAQTAMAMAAPSFLQTALAQPGFSLFEPADGAAGGDATTGTVSLAAATAPPAQAGNGAQGVTALAADTAATGADPTTPASGIRLASARTAAPPGPARTAPRADTASDSADTPSFHSPTSQSADDVSPMENAPSAIPQLASAGTTATAQTLAASGGAANPAALVSTAVTTQQPASAPTDMAALVDRLVEARAAARSGLGAQSTMASIAHTDFGRVSLRFDQDDAGMNISLTSRDPGFAPAAQAALAQNPAVAASTQGHGAGQSGGQQNSGQQWTQASFQGGAASGGGQNASSGGQGWAQGSQNQRNPILQAQVSAAASTGDKDARRRSGILA